MTRSDHDRAPEGRIRPNLELLAGLDRTEGTQPMTQLTGDRFAERAMYAGLALTVLATVLPFVDRASSGVLAEHIRSGYPAYSQSRIDQAVTTYLVLLTLVGVLGAAGWLATIRAVRTRRAWARPVATTMLAVGIGTGLVIMLTRDTSGDTGLPLVLGGSWLVATLPGVLAVQRLWRRPPGAEVP